MSFQITVDEVLFSVLPEDTLFVLVIKQSNEVYHLERFIYHKHTHGKFNAVLENYDGESCDQGWTVFKKDQLVFPLA